MTEEEANNFLAGDLPAGLNPNVPPGFLPRPVPKLGRMLFANVVFGDCHCRSSKMDSINEWTTKKSRYSDLTIQNGRSGRVVRQVGALS